MVGSRTGIVFNNMMEGLSTSVNRGINVLGPGRSGMSAISPVLVTDIHGDVVLVLGGSGGYRIITSTASVSSIIK